MFSYEILFEVHGVVAFADRAEQIAYNALPATWADPANSGIHKLKKCCFNSDFHRSVESFISKLCSMTSPSASGSMWNHQYLQQCNEINAEIENDHIWATDGPDAIMYGLEPNYGTLELN